MRGGALESTNWMVISDPNIEPDDRGNINLRKFPLNETQYTALTILYERENQDSSKMFRLKPSFRDREAGRNMSPIKIFTKENKETDKGIEELPRLFEKLYVSSMDNDNNNRSRKLMSIDKKPFPGVCVKYQGHESNPPAYIVYLPDIKNDEEFIKSQLEQLYSIRGNLSSDNLEYIDTRIQQLKGVLTYWSRIGFINILK